METILGIMFIIGVIDCFRGNIKRGLIIIGISVLAMGEGTDAPYSLM